MKYLLFANTDWYLYNFRLPLAEHLRKEGHQVVLISPPGEYGMKLVERGYEWIPFSFSRRGTNPVAELMTLFRLCVLYRRVQPDLVHHFTIKCVVYGGIAARFNRIRGRVAAITGMGHVFTTDSLRNRMIRRLSGYLYRASLKETEVIFQNPEDMEFFLAIQSVSRANSHLISGSGVDTTIFSPSHRTREARQDIKVVMVARLLKEKGVWEFIEAAGILRSTRPEVKFHLIGDIDEGNPSSLSKSDVARINADGCVALPGHLENISEVLRNSDIAVLPSYREGTPRSLLEAAACGLPIVASNVAGCRQIARAGENALLVPTRDAKALAEAIALLADDHELRSRLSNRSREIAVSEYQVESVVRKTRDVQERALALAKK